MIQFYQQLIGGKKSLSLTKTILDLAAPQRLEIESTSKPQYKPCIETWDLQNMAEGKFVAFPLLN